MEIRGKWTKWLLELTADYYDLASFPNCEWKRVLKKQIGKNAKEPGSNWPARMAPQGE